MIFKRLFTTTKQCYKKNNYLSIEKQFDNVSHLITQSHKLTVKNQKRILLNQKILLSIHIGTGLYGGYRYYK